MSSVAVMMRHAVWPGSWRAGQGGAAHARSGLRAELGPEYSMHLSLCPSYRVLYHVL